MDDATSVLDFTHVPTGLRPVIAALATVGIDLAATIRRGPRGGALGAAVGTNLGGDGQKALDVMADAAFAAALRGASVRWYASEEQDTVVPLDPAGAYALAIDPLDGSSNIDVNISIGTIFSVFAAKDDPTDSFLRPATEQIAAGYLVYGPQLHLVVTFGDGTQHYIHDPETGQFHLLTARMQILTDSYEFAINASNYRHWPAAVRSWFDDRIAGVDGPRNHNFNMRWVASLVAETHRILMRGGVFLYPGDTREGYARGRLRMVYECAPMAMLVEQAGGRATDGERRLLSQTAGSLHARTPFVFGSATKVDRIATYFDLPDTEVSALFGTRGLFRI